VNTTYVEFDLYVAPDESYLIFSSDRPGSTGQYPDLWITTRRSTSDPWQEPINLGPTINTDEEDYAKISPDGTMLFITYWERPGGYGREDIWQVPVIPIVDLNGDGNIDSGDMCIMVDHWGEDYSLCDIGPTPWGDGIVDIADLEVLAEHIFEEVDDHTLIAHWPLDETEGMTTRESVSGGDAYAVGDPTWEPASGKIGGALRLDGVDDCVVVGSVLDPAEGPFSILTWIKDGAPDQAIISLSRGANCLMLDAEGNLMTELTSSGRDGSSLISEAKIDDGQWHRVGLIWDGLYRRLCVDDAVVAEDIHDGLGGSGNGLYIGTGKAMEPGTFFSGLIDEVRIYNRAVSP